MGAVLWVALGGALGAMLRYAAVQWVMRLHPSPFPLGTLLVNGVGALLMGMLMARLTAHPNEPMRLLLATGVLGGFTTFSAFAWDILQQWQRGEIGQALGYMVASVGVSLLAVALGFWWIRA